MVLSPRVVLAGLLFAHPVLAADPAPNFSGHWAIDPGQSDDAVAKINQAVGSDITTGQSGPGYEGHGGLGILPTGDMKEVERVALRKELLDALPALARIEIAETPDEFKYVDADDNVRIFYFKREHTRETRVGTKVKCRARREGTRAVIVEEGEQVTLTESFSVTPDHLLVHWLTMEGTLLHQPLTMKLIYKPAP
jgi:hypothetical protein